MPDFLGFSLISVMRLALKPAIVTLLFAGCAAPEPTAIPKPGMAIWAAAETGNRKVILRHLAAGTDPNAKDKRYGASSLHWAAWCGHLDIVELIIEARANINPVNFDGETPLDCANNFSQDKIATILRRHGGKTAAELKAGATK